MIGTQVFQKKVLPFWQVPSSVCIRQHFGNRTGQLSEFLKSSYPEKSQEMGNVINVQEILVVCKKGRLVFCIQYMLNN